jgi:hypothetical protein
MEVTLGGFLDPVEASAWNINLGLEAEEGRKTDRQADTERGQETRKEYRSARSNRTTHKAFRFALCRSSSSKSSLRWDHDFGIAVGGLGTPGGRDNGGMASRSAVFEGPA